MNRDNIRQVVEMGANWIVAGSAVFGADDPAAEARVLQNLMAGAPRAEPAVSWQHGRGVLDSSLHLRVRTDNWSSGSGEIPYRR